MEKVSKYLQDHPQVNEVNLCYNEIGDEGLEIICRETLSRENNLIYLNIMGCDITEAGMKSFYFTTEKGFVKLKTLRLAGNKLGSQVIICLSITKFIYL